MKGALGVMMMGAVAILIGLVMFGSVILPQLTTTITTTNASASLYPGLTSIQGVSGIVIFLALIGSGIAMIGGGAWVGIQNAKSRFTGGHKDNV